MVRESMATRGLKSRRLPKNRGGDALSAFFWGGGHEGWAALEPLAAPGALWREKGAGGEAHNDPQIGSDVWAPDRQPRARLACT